MFDRKRYRDRGAWLVGGMIAAAWHMPAAAQQAAPPSPSAREVALETRLRELEAAVATLRSELEASRGGAAAVATVSPSAKPPAENAVAGSSTAVAAQGATSTQSRPAPPADGKAPAPSLGGFAVGGTTVRINGHFKAVAASTWYPGGSPANESVGRDFYFPSFIPVGGRAEGPQTEFNAKQTRFTLSTETPVGNRTLRGMLEMDFQVVPGTQGNQRVVSGYNPGLRRAYLEYGGFLAGQDWTTFQYVPALPETTDFLGPSDGSVFVRQALFRYTHKLSKALSLSVSAESPETSYATPTVATIVGTGNDRIPDFAARLNWKPGWGELSLAGIARQLTVAPVSPGDDATAFSWGVSGAGKVPFGPKGRHDIRFMLTYGDGLGRYAGLNLFPDAIYVEATRSLHSVRGLYGFGAFRYGWTPKLRSTLTGSFQQAYYQDGFRPAAQSDSSYSAAINLFYTVVPNLDVGIEYRHARRELNSGAAGTLDRSEFAIKYTF